MADTIGPPLPNHRAVFLKCDKTLRPFDPHKFLDRSPALEDELPRPIAADLPRIIDLNALAPSFGSRFLETYMHHLESGQLVPQTLSVTADGRLMRRDVYRDLINLYLLGVHMRDVVFQDALMDALLAQYEGGRGPGAGTGGGGEAWVPSPNLIEHVYRSTSPASPLRKFVVDVHLWAGVVPSSSQVNGGFVEDLIGALDLQTDKTISCAPIEVARRKMALYHGGASSSSSPSIPVEFRACDYHRHLGAGGSACSYGKRKRAMEGDGGSGRIFTVVKSESN
jgi:hypothetical protein